MNQAKKKVPFLKFESKIPQLNSEHDCKFVIFQLGPQTNQFLIRSM